MKKLKYHLAFYSFNRTFALSHEALTSHGSVWRRYPDHGKMQEIPSVE